MAAPLPTREQDEATMRGMFFLRGPEERHLDAHLRLCDNAPMCALSRGARLLWLQRVVKDALPNNVIPPHDPAHDAELLAAEPAINAAFHAVRPSAAARAEEYLIAQRFNDETVMRDMFASVTPPSDVHVAAARRLNPYARMRALSPGAFRLWLQRLFHLVHPGWDIPPYTPAVNAELEAVLPMINAAIRDAGPELDRLRLVMARPARDAEAFADADRAARQEREVVAQFWRMMHPENAQHEERDPHADFGYVDPSSDDEDLPDMELAFEPEPAAAAAAQVPGPNEVAGADAGDEPHGDPHAEPMVMEDEEFMPHVRELIVNMRRDFPDNSNAHRLGRIHAMQVLFAMMQRAGHDADIPRAMIEIMRVQPTWIDMGFMYDKMSMNQYHQLYCFWCDTVKPDRDELLRVFRMIPSNSRLASIQEALDRVPHLRKGFIHWPCAADTEFVRRIIEMLPQDGDKSALLQEVFDHHVPLPSAGGENLMGEGTWELYYWPIMQDGPVLSGYREEVVQSIIESVGKISDPFRSGLVNMLVAGMPKFDIYSGPRAMTPSERGDARRKVMAMVSQHALRIDMRARRAAVSAARDMEEVVAALPPDEKVRTVVDPDTKEERVPKELEHMVCVICMENKIASVFVPCGHLVACRGCFDRMPAPKRCPTCRAAVQHAQPCFL